MRDLDWLPPEILFIPLAGHTRGHAGVAIKTLDGWLLHAGDAYFNQHEMAAKRRCPPGMQAYQWMMEVDHDARVYNQDRLRTLALDRAKDVSLFCSHDAVELATFVNQASKVIS